MAVPKRKRLVRVESSRTVVRNYRFCVRCEGIVRSGTKACISCRRKLKLD